MYITNIPDGKLDYTKNARDSSRNSGEQDGKPSSLLEKPDQLIRKYMLNAYGESKTDDKREKGKERTTNTWRARKITDTIPTKNGRELVEKWVVELMTNF